MEELLKYFDWVAVVMASVASSLALAVINQTNKGQQIHNGWIAFGVSIFFSVLLIDWTGFELAWQSKTFQFSLTVMVACLLAVSRGQDLVDGLLSFLLNKAGVKRNIEAQKEAPKVTPSE